MKSWILSHKILAIVLACVLGAGAICAVVLPIALAHKHEFSAEWSTDENYHWHKCKDEKCEEVADKAAHVWNEGVVTTPATETTEGVKTYTCTVCGKTKTATIGILDHVHTFDTERWEYDTANHWHPATCAHTDEKKDIAAHTFDDGVVTKPEGYGVVGEKKFTCTVCKYSKTEEIPALGAKDNTISFANDLVEEKTYDGLAFIIDPAKVNRKGDGEITVTYMGENDTAFTATAPTNVGEYTVKVSVAATAEWKGGEITTTITINKREVTLPAGVFERKFGENLESGKFGLTCINVAADTNNVVEWVTIGAPETYYAIGIHTIGFNSLTVDNDNFELNKGVYDTVRFTVWNAPDSFYAGIQDLYTFSGRSDILITTIIANGTVKKGDVLGVARIAGIMAAKRTSELIPLCHPLPLTKVCVDFELLPEQQAVEARCTVKTSGVTGVEMEALTGVSTALLTIYDMCKAVDKGMELSGIHLVEKTGGKSGHYIRAEGGYV